MAKEKGKEQEIYKLNNQVQYYPWGSLSDIPELLGIDNSEEKPWAELWMGAHSKAPSTALTLRGNIPLDKMIEHEPRFLLGADVCDRFSGRLPFLFKVLAAAKPLSIQAHPNKLQAEEGFSRENKANISLDDNSRNYKDNNHKPEIICALTPFLGMCGFRKLEEIQALFNHYVDGIAEYKSITFDTIKNFFYSLMTLTQKEQTALVTGAVQKVEYEYGLESKKIEAAKGPLEARLLYRFYQEYGADIGVLAPLYLQIVELTPGQGLFLPPGVLHAYIDGLGVEVMANSDNVLRGGLTKKHVDVRELLKVLAFESKPLDIIEAKKIPSGEYIYPAPVTEFQLAVISADSLPMQRKVNSIEIIFVYRGEVVLNVSGFNLSDKQITGMKNSSNSNDNYEISKAGKGKYLVLKKGESALIPAGVQEYDIQTAASKAAEPTAEHNDNLLFIVSVPQNN